MMMKTSISILVVSYVTNIMLWKVSNGYVMITATSRKRFKIDKPLTSSYVPSNRSRSFVIYSKAKDVEKDEEIDRLRSMAAKLRAEAASLEAERAQTLSEAANKAFLEFDLNKDGSVNLEELKIGLEKKLKIDLSDARVAEVMKTFDDSGDGELQPNEFVTIDKFRNKISEFARKEKLLVSEAKKIAIKEAENAKMAEAVMEQLNNKPPTNSDKLLSVLPYLFPLMDGLQYGRFLFRDESNPIVALIAITFGIYRSIPFSGFLAFFALSILSGNFKINQLIRYNMQQSIYIDIALFFPSLLAAIGSLALNSLGAPIPKEVGEFGFDAVFLTLIITLAYCTVSSLLGVTPDKLPVISKAVNDRLPSIESFNEFNRVNTSKDKEKNDDGNDEEKS